MCRAAISGQRYQPTALLSERPGPIETSATLDHWSVLGSYSKDWAAPVAALGCNPSRRAASCRRRANGGDRAGPRVPLGLVRERGTAIFPLAHGPSATTDHQDVVVHQLVHLREAHHTPAFWARVEWAMPDSEPRKRWLAERGRACTEACQS